MNMAPSILVADDELGIITALQSTFRDKLNETVFAISLSDARALWEKHSKSIRLVITDFSLKDGFGTDLANQVLGESKNTKVIVFTGFMKEAVSFAGDLCDRALLIEKPFTPRGLRGAVDACLAGI